MTEIHPTPEVLEAFVLGHLCTMEMRDVARHLLTGCPECNAVTASLWEPADELDDPLPFMMMPEAEDEAGAGDAYDGDKYDQEGVLHHARSPLFVLGPVEDLGPQSKHLDLLLLSRCP